MSVLSILGQIGTPILVLSIFLRALPQAKADIISGKIKWGNSILYALGLLVVAVLTIALPTVVLPNNSYLRVNTFLLTLWIILWVSLAVTNAVFWGLSFSGTDTKKYDLHDKNNKSRKYLLQIDILLFLVLLAGLFYFWSK